MKIITLDQRSPDWLTWRDGGIGASETAMIQGISPFGSGQKLWEQKTKRRPRDKLNPAMLKGQLDEPFALSAYEELTGEIMIPLCAEHDTLPFIRASFDGIRPDHTKILEIKCPSLRVHEAALNGTIQPYYLTQMHQQMLVAGLDEVDYFSYYKEHPDPAKRGILINVKRSDILTQEIINDTTVFWEHVTNDKPLYEEGWEQAAAYWLSIKYEMDYLADEEEKAKQALFLLAGGKDMQGAGVSVTYSTKKGSIDYKAACTDKGLTEAELETFRKPDAPSVSIRKIKQNPVTEEERTVVTAAASTTILVNTEAQSESTWSW